MAKKRVFALFSSSIFEICSRNANKGICSSSNCSTCWKNAFLQCFHYQFSKTSLETRIKAFAAVANVQHAEKRVFALFSSSTLKSLLETQIKAYAVVANAQHAGKRVVALISSSIFEICSRNANKGTCSSRKCSTWRKNAFLHRFHYQLWNPL